jgi:TolB-like protein/Tfp pilus assembly protein PilF
MSGFISELKRRNVVRMAGLYLVGAWLMMQVAATLLPVFDAPGWVMKVLVGLLAFGFLAALVFSWVYELTPDGLKRDGEVDPANSIAPQTAQRMDRLILGGLAAVILVVAADRYWPSADAPAAGAPLVSESAGDSAKPGDAADAIHPDSIAVLPFVNMSNDPEQEYFSDGLSEEILNLLAQIRELKVIGRTSSFAFKGRNEDLRTIGDKLGVAYLLEGSVRKAGDDLRITAQLIEVEGGSHLWSQTYDRKLENVFAIQSEIAASIAQALKINLVDTGHSAPVAQAAASLPAYDRFLQARRLIHGRTRDGIEAARKLLDEALVLDPNYAPALAAQAQVMMLLRSGAGSYGDLPHDQARAMAEPLLARALALDSQLAEAHAVQGLIFLEQEDVVRGEAALNRALALNANQADALHWQAGMLGNAGRLREELAARQRLAQFDPLNVANLFSLNGVHRNMGNAAEAEATTARLLATFPDNPQGFGAQAFDLYSVGRLAEAQVPAARSLALKATWASQLIATVRLALGDFDQAMSAEGTVRQLALAALDRFDEAVAAARERSAKAPEDRDAARDLLGALAWAGRHDEVLALYRERWGDLAALDAYFRVTEMAPMEFIATAQRARGQQPDLAQTLAHWRKRIDFLREQGADNGPLLMGEARYFALAGERVEALTTLTQAIDRGVRTPLLALEPAFAELQGDPAFQAQVARMTGLINTERAKLGMAPLP